MSHLLRFYSALRTAPYHVHTWYVHGMYIPCMYIHGMPQREHFRCRALWLANIFDLVIFLFYRIGSLHRVFYFENWPDTLCLSCVSDFLLAQSALCSLLRLLSKLHQAAVLQSCYALLDSTVCWSWLQPLVICNTLSATRGWILMAG